MQQPRDESVIIKTHQVDTILKNGSNAPSAAAKGSAVRSAEEIALARSSQSILEPETKTKINILIQYLRFLCKVFTHHKQKIEKITDENIFKQVKNKKNKIKLY